MAEGVHTAVAWREMAAQVAEGGVAGWQGGWEAMAACEGCQEAGVGKVAAAVEAMVKAMVVPREDVKEVA